MSEKTFAASAPQVVWMGRTLVSGDSVTMGFPGVGMRVRFRGTGIALELETNSPKCYFGISIDGSAAQILRARLGWR